MARCAPPDNKPLPVGIAQLRAVPGREFDLLRPRAVLALGAIAFNAYLALLLRRGEIPSRAPYSFAHGAESCCRANCRASLRLIIPASRTRRRAG